MGTELTNYDEQWAKDAQEFADRERSGGSFLGISGGIFKLGDDPIEGNQLCVVILDSIFENTFYEGDWDPDNLQPPVCYAMAHDEDELAPHPAMEGSDYFKPQNDQCAGCPKNEWGSADKGKGKACKNKRRLALIPAGFYEKVKGTRSEYEPEIIEDEEHYKLADMLILKLPVMSGKEYSKYVKSLSRNDGKPPYGVITRIYAEPQERGGFKICFEKLEDLPNDFYATIHARHMQAREDIITTYSAPDEGEEEKPAAKTTAKSRLRRVKK